MKCSYCESYFGGAYQDYSRGFKFNLCLSCSKELGFIPNCMKNHIKCASCGKYFTPRARWQHDCTDCWIKANPQKKRVAVTFTEVPTQRKLNFMVINGSNI